MLLMAVWWWWWGGEIPGTQQGPSASSAHMLQDHYDADVAVLAEKAIVQKLPACSAA
jgi:hypothetical protein